MPRGGTVPGAGGGFTRPTLPGSGFSWNWENFDFANAAGGLATYLGGNPGKAGQAALVANAEDALAVAGINAAGVQKIAGINAAAIRNVGYANAAAIERAAIRNGKLMMVEGTERMRRMVRAERYIVGNIRARQAATGWSVNEGTLVLYKESQKAELYKQKEYAVLANKMSLFTMLTNEFDKAGVTRYAADQNASALQASAAIEAEMLLAEGQMQYNAMIRQGELLAAQGRLQQQAGLSQFLGTVGSAIGYGFAGPIGGMAGGFLGSTLGGIL